MPPFGGGEGWPMIPEAAPLPCCVCGQPVRRLGAIGYRRAEDDEGPYVAGLYVICLECLLESQLEHEGVTH